MQGVHLDDSTSAVPAHCECSDTDPVCPRCGGSRRSRDPVGVASVGVSTAGMQPDHVTQAPPTAQGDGGVSEHAPVAAAVADDNDAEGDKDEVRCLQRLRFASETAVPRHQHPHHPQTRSFSTVTDSFSALPYPPADVGGVSARSAPDSAVPVRQPEVTQDHGGQRSKLQRFFEPLKRSKSTGNHKDTLAAAQASLYDPTRQHIPVYVQ